MLGESPRVHIGVIPTSWVKAHLGSPHMLGEGPEGSHWGPPHMLGEGTEGPIGLIHTSWVIANWGHPHMLGDGPEGPIGALPTSWVRSLGVPLGYSPHAG